MAKCTLTLDSGTISYECLTQNESCWFRNVPSEIRTTGSPKRQILASSVDVVARCRQGGGSWFNCGCCYLCIFEAHSSVRTMMWLFSEAAYCLVYKISYKSKNH